MQQSCQPMRRNNDLSLQHVALETLVYDELAHKAFCLNEVAATVWNLLDGNLTPAELAVAASAKLGYTVTEDVVVSALAQFESDHLLAPVAAPVFVEAGLVSRRRLMGGMTAGALLMLPVVAAVMTPSAHAAYNGCVDCSVQQGNGSVAAQAPPTKTPDSSSTPMFNDEIKK